MHKNGPVISYSNVDTKIPSDLPSFSTIAVIGINVVAWYFIGSFFYNLVF